MRVLFNLLATIEIPDADFFPPKESVEKEITEVFEEDGAIVHSLEVTNYAMAIDEESEKDDGR